MYKLACVTAKKINKNEVVIDTKDVAQSSDERKNIDHPWWVIGSAAFLFNVEGKECVALVQRTHNVSDPCRWALIPAGVADCVCELKHPGELIIREANEELKIRQNGEWVSPFHVSTLISEDKVSIYDEFTEETYQDVGQVFTHERKAYFLRVYRIKDDLEDFILYDGEKDENGKDLKRVIAARARDRTPPQIVKCFILLIIPGSWPHTAARARARATW